MISALRWTTQWTKLHEVQNSTMYWLTLKYFLNWPLFPRFIQIPFHFHQIFSHFLMMKQLSLFLYAYKTIFTLTLVWYKMLKPFFSFCRKKRSCTETRGGRCQSWRNSHWVERISKIGNCESHRPSFVKSQSITDWLNI